MYLYPSSLREAIAFSTELADTVRTLGLQNEFLKLRYTRLRNMEYYLWDINTWLDIRTTQLNRKTYYAAYNRYVSGTLDLNLSAKSK